MIVIRMARLVNVERLRDFAAYKFRSTFMNDDDDPAIVVVTEKWDTEGEEQFTQGQYEITIRKID